MVEVDFTDEEYSTDEGAGQVEVCLFLSAPIDTPLTVYVEAIEATPTSATGRLAQKIVLIIMYNHPRWSD